MFFITLHLRGFEQVLSRPQVSDFFALLIRQDVIIRRHSIYLCSVVKDYMYEELFRPELSQEFERNCLSNALR